MIKLPFLPKRMKIEKVEKFLASSCGKKCYAHNKPKTSTKLWISTAKKCIESLDSIHNLG